MGAAALSRQKMAAARERLIVALDFTTPREADAGYAFGVQDLVARRAAQACEAGIDGLILSAGEARAIRASLGRKMILVTPGIRPEGAAAADQKRAQRLPPR